MKNYLHIHGSELLALGYDVVPIETGSKACKVKGWATVEASKEKIESWARTYSGCGIRGPRTVGVDLDIYDKGMTQKMLNFTRQNYGEVPFRVGLDPKALLPYRCERPFKKAASAQFQSPDGQKHKVEILADGQQFVSSHIHPETKKPYMWFYPNGSQSEFLNIPWANLPVIDESDAHKIIEEFEKLCVEAGWERTDKTATIDSSRANHNSYDEFIPQSCPEDQRAIVRDALLSISSDDRHLWQRMGHALKTEGAEGWAHDLFFEWSAKSNNHNPEADEQTWLSFKPTRTDYRSILAEAQRHGWINPASKHYTDDRISKLASLPALEYERIRSAEAESLGFRISVLDKEVESARCRIQKQNGETDKNPDILPNVEPWPDPVNGNELLQEIYNQISKYIVCDESVKVAATLWCLFTWFIKYVSVAPIAYISAPEKRCGKSQLLALISYLSCRALIASNITPAAVFRVIESCSPTLIIDEADSFINDEANELRGIINSGHTRQSAYVIRLVGENHEPKQFSTWGAKAIAGIGTLPATIMDRSINLKLRRKLHTENIQRLRHASLSEFYDITRKMARFALDNGDSISKARPELPEALNDRAQDNWEPLLAIADLIQGNWPERARTAALQLSGSEDEVRSNSIDLLSDIKEIFDDFTENKISSAQLIERLCKDDEKPWATYNRGQKLTPRTLSNLLKDYGIVSKNINFRSEGTRRGYVRDVFNDAFNRYLHSAAITPHLMETADLTVAEDSNGGATEILSATPECLENINNGG